MPIRTDGRGCGVDGAVLTHGVASHDRYRATVELAGDDLRHDREVVFAEPENGVAGHLVPLE